MAAARVDERAQGRPDHVLRPGLGGDERGDVEVRHGVPRSGGRADVDRRFLPRYPGRTGRSGDQIWPGWAIKPGRAGGVWGTPSETPGKTDIPAACLRTLGPRPE